MFDPIVSYNTNLTPGVTNLTPAPALGPIYDYTPNLGLNLVNFDWATWHDYEWDNWRTVDGVLFSLLGITNISGTWQPNTAYAQGTRVIGPDGRIYEADADFTSGAVFDPQNWTVLSPNQPQSVGEWQTATNYSPGDFIWSTPDAQYGVVNNSYTSGASWTDDVTAGDISVLLDLTGVLGDYLPLTGGDLTGPITFSGTALVGRISNDLRLSYTLGNYISVASTFIRQQVDVAGETGALLINNDDATLSFTSRQPLSNGSILTKADADALYSTAGVTVSDTEPVGAANGDMWYCTVDPVGLFIYYDDGDSEQWVQSNGGAGSVGASGTFTTVDGKTVTVNDGRITGIV